MHVEWAGDFFPLVFKSSYLNCEAVVFLIKTVIPPFMHLEKGTIQKRSSSVGQKFSLRLFKLWSYNQLQYSGVHLFSNFWL